MRPVPAALLCLAVSAAACGGADAGYRAPTSGCEGWSFCDSIETRGRFDALQGFLRTGEVIAYRDLREDGTASAWFSTPTAEEAIAPRAVRSVTSPGPERAELIVAVPRTEGAEGYESALYGGRIDLRRWTPGGGAVLLAENVVSASWALCGTGEWLWTIEGESSAQPFPNCGDDVLRNLRDGRVATLPDQCSAHDWYGRFTPDCRFFTGSWSTLHVDLASGERTPGDPSWRLDPLGRDDRHLLLAAGSDDPDDPSTTMRIVRASDLGAVARVDDVYDFGQRTFSPDGAWFAYDRFGGSDRKQVHVVHLADDRRVSVQAFGAIHSAVAFSPAGDRAAYLSWSDVTDDALADLVLFDLADGSARTLDRSASGAVPRHTAPTPYYGHSVGRPPFSFDATGRWLVFARASEEPSVRDRERELVVADTMTGATRALSPPAACPDCAEHPLLLSSAHSADGRWLAWVSPKGSLYLADLAAGDGGARVSEGPVADVVFGDGELAWISKGYLLVAPLDP